jgi:Cu/Ag efflux protein CusF
MRNSMMTSLLVLSCAALPAFAQQAPTASGGVASAPGKAVAAETIKASVLVTAIDPATRKLTLKDAGGKVFDLVAGDEVKNFAQIKVSDEVVIEYVRALSLELKKGGKVRERHDATDAVRAKPGEKPAAAAGRRVSGVADVIDVNEAKKTITLKGPKGNIVELDVKNPDHFKVVKKGDQVEFDYVEAIAVSVQPAPKKDAKKDAKK